MYSEKEIIKLYKNKEISVFGLSKKYKCSVGIIRKILEENNIKIVKRQGAKKIRRDVWTQQNKIIKTYPQKSISKIASLYDCDKSVICSILKENNIEIVHGNLKNNASYSAIHTWIRNHKPKVEFCEICGEAPPREIANKSGECLRDINDYWWVCFSCHKQLDMTGKRPKEWRENISKGRILAFKKKREKLKLTI